MGELKFTPMGRITPQYGTAAIADLKNRTEYELWLLEAVYEIADKRIAVEGVDELVYPSSGGPPVQTFYGSSSIKISDWRLGFLEAGAPLVFVTGFKLLDMLLEWVLVENGSSSTHRFSEKIRALKSSPQFPLIIETRPWLRDRLVALYEHLDPLRGTVIHDRHFTASGGVVKISSSRHRVVGPAITISAADLRNLALVAVSLLRYVEGTWTIDVLGDKRMKKSLDELAHLHGLPELGQRPPGFLNVRIYAFDDDLIEWDIEKIRMDVAMRRPGQDVIFDLRIIVVSRDGQSLSAYLLPWAELEKSARRRRRSDLAPFAVEPPPELDALTIAKELSNR